MKPDKLVINIVVLILILSIIAIVAMVGSELFYGDWRCAFAECRIIVEGKNP